MEAQERRVEATPRDGAVELIEAASANLTMVVKENEMSPHEQLLAISVQAELAAGLARLAIADALMKQAEVEAALAASLMK